MYKRSSSSYEIDNDTKFSIYEQEEQHLADEDLLKYLNDFKSKEKYLNKLAAIAGEIKISIRGIASNVQIENKSRK